jgi:prevent-host-death family protein
VATRTIKASEFKAKCLGLMDEVRDTGDTITITKNGEAVAELRAAKRPRKTLWGVHAGLVEIRGDTEGSVFEEWTKEE